MSKFLSEVKGFTPVIDVLAQELGLMTAVVYGIVWRYCQMEGRVCTASLDRIAEHANINRRTVERHIKDLCDAGYLEDKTPDKRHRPHIYADTGRAKIAGLLTVEISTTESRTHDQSTTESPVSTTESRTSTTESRTQYDRKYHKESIYDTSRKREEGEKENEFFSKNPDPLSFDLDRQTLNNKEGNYAIPAQAGGDDRLTDAALFALYSVRGKRPPRKGTKEWDRQRDKVADALKAYGYEKASISLVEKAAELFCDRKGDWTNVFYPSFPMDFGQALSDAEAVLVQDALRHGRDMDAMQESLAALEERRAARPPPPEDDETGGQIKAALQTQVGRNEFRQYVEPSGFTCDDGLLHIAAPDAFTRDWLENRLSVTIRRALAGVAGGSGEIVFEIMSQEVSDAKQ